MKRILVLLMVVFLANVGWAGEKRYIVELDQPSVAQAVKGLVHTKAAIAHRQTILKQQAELQSLVETELEGAVIRSFDMVFNGLVVTMDETRVDELCALPGVLGVTEDFPKYRLTLNESNRVSNVLMLQQRLGLTREQMGQGIKIGIVDTGIQASHPSFNDTGYTYPAGFDPGATNEAAYTNNKVIVAKNFGTDSNANDIFGHGTAAASCAAGRPTLVAVGDLTMNIAGAAPGAYLGNYKVFDTAVLPANNSPQAYVSNIIAGVNEAVVDGMDIINLSLGGEISGPAAADPEVRAIGNAVLSGSIVCVSAGNEGYVYDVLGGDVVWESFDLAEESVGTPGNAPTAITVGATENRRSVAQGGTAYVEGGDTPAELETFAYGTDDAVSANLGQFGMYELVDITDFGVNEEGCTAYAGGVDLTGKIALIKRGTCSFCVKISHAEQAGALGVVVYNHTADGLEGGGIINMAVLGSLDSPDCFSYPTTIPGYFLRLEEGQILKGLLDDGKTVMIGFGMVMAARADVGYKSRFSSVGPTKYDYYLKPDVVAVGNQLALATQNNRSVPDNSTGAERTMYTESGFAFNISGTSFSSPYVAGCAAVLKEMYPELTPTEIKGLLATTGNFTYDYHQPEIGWDNVVNHDGIASPVFQGGGMVDVDRAASAKIAITPANIGFQRLAVSGTDPQTSVRQLTLTNISDETMRLKPVNRPICSNDNAYLDFNEAEIEIAPGSSATLDVTAHYQGEVDTDLQGYVILLDNFGNVYQVAYFGRFESDMSAYGSSSDTDADGLTKSQESFMGTDIFRADTDNDGTDDLDEVDVTGTDPANATSKPVPSPESMKYYLPYSTVEYGNDGEYRTDVYMANTSYSTTHVRMFCYDNVGDLMAAPQEITMQGRGFAKIPLGPGIDPSGLGWIMVSANREVAVMGDVRSIDGNGATLHSFAIPATETLSSSLYVPHVAEQVTQWDTHIGVANPGTTNVTATFTPQGGSAQLVPSFGEMGTSSYVDVINSMYGGSYPFDPSDADHWWGTVDMGGTGKAAGLVGMESFIQVREDRNMYQSAGLLLNDTVADEIIIAHVETSWLWWTGIALNNPAGTDATITMTPYSAAGTPLAVTTFTLEAGAKMVRLVQSFWEENAVAFDSDTAWIRVTSDVPITGYELFGIDSSGDPTDNRDALAGVEALVAPSDKLRFAYTPKASDWMWAGIVLLNASSESVTVTIRAYNALGDQVGSKIEFLTANKKLVKVVNDDLFGTLGNDVCWIEADASAPIYGFELFGGQDFLFLSGIPAL